MLLNLYPIRSVRLRARSFRVSIFPISLAMSFLSLGVFVVGGGTARAQGQGAVGSTRSDYGISVGSHTIKGTIHLNDGSPLNGRRFRVTLEGTDQPSRNTSTDVDGAFSFNSVPAGNWTVVVEASDEYEGAREASPIDRAAGGPVNIVDIFVKRKITTDPAFAGIPKPALDAYSKGMEAAGKNDEKKALENFNKAISLYPDFSQALTEAGAIYIKQKNYDKAVEVLQKAVALKPNSFDARFNYGAALYYKQDLAKAEPEFREAIKLREASAMAHMYLGFIVIKAKKYDEARNELNTAVNLPGGANVAQAHLYLGGLYYSSDPKRAADELELYLKLQPNAPDAEKTKDTIKQLRAKANG